MRRGYVLFFSGHRALRDAAVYAIEWEFILSITKCFYERIKWDNSLGMHLQAFPPFFTNCQSYKLFHLSSVIVRRLLNIKRFGSVCVLVAHFIERISKIQFRLVFDRNSRGHEVR